MTILIAALVGGLGFYGGMKYARSSSPSNSFQRGGEFRGMRLNGMPMGAVSGTMMGGQGGNRLFAAGGMNNGEVVAKDDQSMTLKLRDGGSKVVFFSASTTLSTVVESSMSSLATGTEVMVMGTTNQDGSITASMIQVRPSGTRMLAPMMR